MSGWAARAKQALAEASEKAKDPSSHLYGGDQSRGGSDLYERSDHTHHCQQEEEEEEEVPFGAPPPPDQPFEAAGQAVGESYATVCWGLLPVSGSDLSGSRDSEL